MKIISVITRNVLFAVAILLVFGPPEALSQVFYNTDAKIVFEDNVVGLVSDKHAKNGTISEPAAVSATSSGNRSGRYAGVPPKSDFSLRLYADLGVSDTVSPSMSLFLMGIGENVSYSTYSDLNSTSGGLRAGVTSGLAAAVTSQAAVFSKIKNYNDADRDGPSYGADLSLKEQVNPRFFLKERYEYEKDRANSPTFSYEGNTVSIIAGFKPGLNSAVYLGYKYLHQKFKEPAGSVVTTQSAFLEIEKNIGREVSVDAGFERIISSFNGPRSTANDNIFYVGLRRRH